MTTRLNLQADDPASIAACPRNSAATASPTCVSMSSRCRREAFAQWLDDDARGAAASLDAAGYADLAQPSQSTAPATFGAVEPRPVRDAIMGDAVRGRDAARESPPAMRSSRDELTCSAS